MHDANGEALAVGDVVSLDCVIKEVHPQEDYCNVRLESVLPPLPPSMGPVSVTANSRQVVKHRKTEMPATSAKADANKSKPESKPAAASKRASGINRS